MTPGCVRHHSCIPAFMGRAETGIIRGIGKRSSAYRTGALITTLLIIGSLSFASAYGQSSYTQSTETDQQKTTISGVVINSLTRAPIGRALVTSSDQRYAMLTDSTGHFEFDLKSNPGMPDQGVWLSARKPGFLDEGQRTISAGPGQDVTIPLTPESLIVGRVTLSTGDAPTGLGVQLFFRQSIEGLPRWIPRGVAQPNSSGEFRFADLSPGSYKILTDEMLDRDPDSMIPGGPLYGYPPAYYSGASDFSSASTIELTAGQTVQADLSLTHQPYYSVNIPVIGEVNGPGMMINVSLQGHKGPGYSLGYNAGSHKIEGLLANGNYVVTATAQGERSFFGTVNIKVAGAPADGPAVNLIPNSSISFNVKEEFTDTTWRGSASWNVGGRTVPLTGPRMYLQGTSVESADDFGERVNSSIRPPLGPNDESLVIEGIPPGRYWIRLHSARGYIAAASMGTTDVLHQPVVIGTGSTASVDVVLRDDYATIDGSVAGVGPAPLTVGPWTPPAWISCVPLADSSGEFQQVPIQSDGKFNFTLPPGSYRVLAFQQQHPSIPYRDPEAMRAFENKGQVIHVEGNQKLSLELHLISGEE